MMGIFSIWQVFRIHVGGRVPPSSSQENSAKNSFLVHFCPLIHFYRFWFFSWFFCSLLTLVNVKPLFSAFLGKVFPKKLSRLFVEGGGVGAPSPILYYIIYGQWTQKTPKPLYGFGILAFFANKWLWWDANFFKSFWWCISVESKEDITKDSTSIVGINIRMVDGWNTI